MNAIEIRNLTKYYGEFQALKGIDLDIKQGEVLGLIGPNGAGKTTTVRILLGLLKKSGGSVKVFGKDAWEDSVEIHERLAYVPDDVRLWPKLTGGEVIDFLASLRGGINEEKRAYYIERFEFDPNKQCRSYSKGNRQKLGLIAAFAADTDLIVFDEPTGGLDPLMSKVFQECVAELKEEGKTILMSSHILADVEKLCDRVAIISHGEIVETGTLDAMRHMKRNLITVRTKKPLSDLSDVEGVHNVEENGEALSFQADNEKIDDIIRHLSAHGIQSLEIAPPTLEDLFMRHYEEGYHKSEAVRDEKN